MKYMHQNRGYSKHSDTNLMLYFARCCLRCCFSPIMQYHRGADLNMKVNANVFLASVDICRFNHGCVYFIYFKCNGQTLVT